MAEYSDKTSTVLKTFLMNRIPPGIISFLKSRKGIALVLLFAAIAFNAIFLWTEVGVSTFELNDNLIHLSSAREASLVLGQGLDPTDFWLRQFDLGVPFFHFYQNLPQVMLAVIDQGTSFILPISHLFDISRYLLLVFFPLSIFWAMRRFEFDWLAAGISAFIASLLSTNGLYGFDYFSYVWSGWGLYTQLWAMFFLPLALAEIYRTIKKEGSWFWPVLLSSIVLLSSLVLAPVLLLSTLIFIVLTPTRSEIFIRFKRAVVIFLFTGLVTCYFFISIIIDHAYVSPSIWEKSTIFNSFGAVAVLTNLFTGNLLDYGRVPVLTILFFLAALAVISQWKKEQYRMVFLVSVFWLVLYFGRFPWGFLIDSLPLSSHIEFVRFICGFHLWAIFLIGAGLSLIVEWSEHYLQKKSLFRTPSFKIPVFIGIVFLLILTPVLLERATFYENNAQWKTETQNAFLAKSSEISAINDTLNNLPPGRVYAGLYADFGNDPYYKIGSVPLYAVFPQLGLDSFGYAYTNVDLSTDVRYTFNNTRPEQYNVYNIRYVILQNTWTAPYYYALIKKFDDYTLYSVPTTGYFDLVDVPAVFYGNSSGFYSPNAQWLSSSLPGLKEYPIIELGSRPDNTSGLPVYSFDEVNQDLLSGLARSHPSDGTILQEKVSTNEYQARFSTSRDCYLVLKTNYHPDWNVTLDGRKVTPVMLTPGFIGIKVDAGTHEALFSYEPPFYRFPLIILGMLILIALLGVYLWKKCW
jgi:hypothetical protein